MFYIDTNDDNVREAKEIHLLHCTCFINKKVGNTKCLDSSCQICNSKIKMVHNLPKQLKFFFSQKNHIELLLGGTPQQLFDLNIRFWKILFGEHPISQWPQYFKKKNLSHKDDFIKHSTITVFEYINYLNKIINYESFCKDNNKQYNAYDLSKKLGRNTCTYCNRTFTSTMITKKGERIMRPNFDHWFSKSKYPLLAMSFHNLIPSCSYCNSSVKGDKELFLSNNTHPYIDNNQMNEFLFDYVHLSNIEEYRIFIKRNGPCEKSFNTVKQFKIDEMYNTHYDELKDLIKIKKNYSETYINQIRDLFGNKLAYEEVYRLLFGVDYYTDNFYKRPLSKFKHDILVGMGIKNLSP